MIGEGIARNNLPKDCQAVVSTFAIHHLSDEQKEIFFKYIFDLLPQNGIFVIADNINPMYTKAEAVAAEDWDIAAYKQSINFAGNLDAYQSFRESGWNIYSYQYDEGICGMPTSLYGQLKMLEKAGF